jgi:hypothetical protein
MRTDNADPEALLAALEAIDPTNPEAAYKRLLQILAEFSPDSDGQEPLLRLLRLLQVTAVMQLQARDRAASEGTHLQHDGATTIVWQPIRPRESRRDIDGSILPGYWAQLDGVVTSGSYNTIVSVERCSRSSVRASANTDWTVSINGDILWDPETSRTRLTFPSKEAAQHYVVRTAKADPRNR